MLGPLEAAVAVVLVVEVPEQLPLPVRRRLPVLEEVRVVVQLQRPLAVQEVLVAVQEVVVAVPVAVPIPRTTRCKTSRLDRVASGPTAPHRS